MSHQLRDPPTDQLLAVVDSGGRPTVRSLAFTMSIQVTHQKADTCAFPDCDKEFQVLNAVAGSYCSQECHDRHAGRRLLRTIRQDHRFCWSCWRPRKELEQPTEEYRTRAFATSGVGLTVDGEGALTAERYGQELSNEAVVGFEHHSRHVTMGPYGLECECGAIDHDNVDWDKREDVAYHWQLKRVIQQMTDEGAHDYQFDVVTFAEELWATDDLELAVGRAIEE